MEIRFSKSRGCNYVNAIHNKQKWTTILAMYQQMQTQPNKNNL